MNRERAETYLRLLAEAEMRLALSPGAPRSADGPAISFPVKVTRVAWVLTAVGALDRETAEWPFNQFIVRDDRDHRYRPDFEMIGPPEWVCYLSLYPEPPRDIRWLDVTAPGEAAIRISLARTPDDAAPQVRETGLSAGEHLLNQIAVRCSRPYRRTSQPKIDPGDMAAWVGARHHIRHARGQGTLDARAKHFDGGGRLGSLEQAMRHSQARHATHATRLGRAGGGEGHAFEGHAGHGGTGLGMSASPRLATRSFVRAGSESDLW